MPFSVDVPNRPDQGARLMQQARDGAVPPLVQAFSTALGRFDDALFDRAERAGPSQAAFLDGMRELRRRRDEIVARFRSHLDRCWKSLEDRNPLSAESVLIDPATAGLSLVSDQELESRLAARNLASVISRECKLVLSRLDRRLGHLGGGLELDNDTNPVGPEHIGLAVHEAFSSSDLTLEVRLVVIKLCERELAPVISRIYEALDERLVQLNVLPQVAPASGTRRRPTPDTQPPAPELQAGDDFFGTVPEEPNAPGWAARFTQRMAGMRRAMDGQGADGHVVGNDSDAQGVLLEALHHFLQETRQQREAAPPPSHAHEAHTQGYSGSGTGNQGAGGERPLSQREMMSVLSVLQASPSATLRAAIGDTGESLSQRLKSEVLSGASQLGVDPSQARLSPMDEDAIDLVGMLFDVMLDERELDGRPRELIGRLVVPFVKVALLDRRMFVQKTHPARRLLNVLAEACEGNTGESAAERTLMTKVEEVIDRLVAEFNENLAVFLTLEEEFRDFLSQHKRRIEVAERRAAEIQRGQERLEAARTRTTAELDQRLQGRRVPQAIEDFLRQPWAHHVTMAVLREGEEGTALHDSLQLADGLLDEVTQAQAQQTNVAWLEAQRAGLIRVFASVGVTGDQAAAAINALRETLQAVAASRPDLEKALPELPEVALPRPIEPEAAAIELVGGTDTLDFDATDADHFRKLPVGTWLDFIDKDNRVQAGKLSWVSPISSRLLFVNRRGVRFCVASPEELAVMVRMGRLRKHHEQDAFDAAMQGVINRLDTGVQRSSAEL
ncbi:MAG: DUF1631 domain-containing protein [Pseudoxanthomonas sp.]